MRCARHPMWSFDVLVCGPDAETAQAGRIAEQISSKVAQ
jgi:hypothetical protein